jgi:Flp pilus assembly protein TadB
VSGLTAGLATALAVHLLLVRPRPATALPPSGDRDDRVATDWVQRGGRVWPVLAGIACWSLVSGWGGLVAGTVAAVLVHHLVAVAEPAVARREREAVRRDLPVLVLLLSVALRAGTATAPAARQACAALPGPASAGLAAACDRLALGVDPEQVWAALADDPGLAPLGRALARSHRTGAPVAPAVERLADDLAATARAEVEDRARAVGVRAAVPLGVCLLPSFLLLGIVPLAASLLTGLRL